MMFSRCKRWFLSSRVKLPLVNMSASWFLVSTYFIWILGPKLILSNNRSSATLWVLETCLIVGFLPLIIILITASLSLKMYNWDSPWEECEFVKTVFTKTKSTFPDSLCSDLDVLFGLPSVPQRFPAAYTTEVALSCGDRNTSSTTSHKSGQKVHSQTSIQRSYFRFCRAVRHWSLLLVHPAGRWRMFDCQKYTELIVKLILNPQDRQQSQSLGIIPVDNVELCLPHDNIGGNHLYDECEEIIRANRLSQAWIHFVIARASLLSTNSGQVQAFQNNLRAYIWQFSNWLKLFLVDLMIIQARARNFAQLLRLFVRQFAISFNAFLSMSFHIVGPRHSFRVRFFLTMLISQLLQHKYAIQTSLDIVQ